jgi:hypothetical protein
MFRAFATYLPIVACLWHPPGGRTLERIGHALGWPPPLLAVAPVFLLPLARRLFPERPWHSWDGGDGSVARQAVPYLRRAASLVEGFLAGGCDPRGVWEAICLPERGHQNLLAREL